jgi:hypothetical protein
MPADDVSQTNKEAFVPDNRLHEFQELLARAAESERLHEQLNESADKKGYSGLAAAATSVGLSGAGIVLGGPPGILMGAAGLASSVKSIINARQGSELRKAANKAGEERNATHEETRSIVEEGMRTAGAKFIDDELVLTEEQIEMARREAEADGVDIIHPEDAQ